MMNRGLLKNQINDWFEQVELNQDQLAELKALQHRESKRTPVRNVYRLAVAAVLVMICFTAFLWNTQNSTLSQVAGQIAQNHHYLNEMEFTSNEFAQIAQRFDKLNFLARLPQNSIGLDLQSLEGARYCSIDGHIALQLKVANSETDKTALYIAAPPNEQIDQLKQRLTDHGQPYVETIGDLAITLWNEEDLLYAVSRSK